MYVLMSTDFSEWTGFPFSPAERFRPFFRVGSVDVWLRSNQSL